MGNNKIYSAEAVAGFRQDSHILPYLEPWLVDIYSFFLKPELN